MKTLKQHNEEEAEARRRTHDERLAKVSKVLDLVENRANIPVYVGPKGDRTDYAKARQGFRDELRKGHLRFVGLACDHCGVELVTDGNLLMSSPPKKRVDCVGCGYIDYVRA